MEALRLRPTRLLGLALLGEGDGGGVDGVPLVAQRLDDGGQDEALDIGARGVVGAELVALAGVEGAFQQGAEDGGLDIAPVGARGLDEQVDLVAVERQGRGVGEEAAVEAQDLGRAGRRRSRRVFMSATGLSSMRDELVRRWRAGAPAGR